MSVARILTSVALLSVAGAAATALGCGGDAGPSQATQPEATQPDRKSSSPKKEEMSLPVSEREYLWQIEHHGNVLSRIGFTALTAALVRGDAKALSGLLSPDFKAELLRQPTEVTIHTDIVDAVRQSDAGRPPVVVDRARFVEYLLEYRSAFRANVKAKLALMKLRPAVAGDLDSPWEGTGQLRIWGETAPGKPREIMIYLKYQVLRPTKEAIEQGGWMTDCAVTQSQVASAEHYLMKEVGSERGLQPDRLQDNWKIDKQDAGTGGVYLCDFDRDGIMDVLVTDVNGYFLYKGLGDGKFSEVTAEVGLPSILPDTSGRSKVACWVDIDGDGWEDLILGPYIYRNDRGKRFVNVTSKCNFRLPLDAAGVAVADYDGDGKLDLYVFHPGKGKSSSWLTGESGGSRGNQLFHNDGNWQFTDVTEKAHAAAGLRSTFTAIWLDANNDGRPDLFVPNEFGNGVLLMNQGDGTFKEQPLADHPDDFGTMGATCGDINNDGHIDIYCGNMYSKAGSRVIGNLRPDAFPPEVMAKFRTFVKGSQLHLNRSTKGGVRFEQKGTEWQVNDAGWAYGAALVDLDNDGWLDIYATAGFISRSRSEPDG
jgi:hypothetical protein